MKCNIQLQRWCWLNYSNRGKTISKNKSLNILFSVYIYQFIKIEIAICPKHWPEFLPQTFFEDNNSPYFIRVITAIRMRIVVIIQFKIINHIHLSGWKFRVVWSVDYYHYDGVDRTLDITLRRDMNINGNYMKEEDVNQMKKKT